MKFSQPKFGSMGHFLVGPRTFLLYLRIYRLVFLFFFFFAWNWMKINRQKVAYFSWYRKLSFLGIVAKLINPSVTNLLLLSIFVSHISRHALSKDFYWFSFIPDVIGKQIIMSMKFVINWIWNIWTQTALFHFSFICSCFQFLTILPQYFYHNASLLKNLTGQHKYLVVCVIQISRGTFSF